MFFYKTISFQSLKNLDILNDKYNQLKISGNFTSMICNRSNTYQCMNSIKCVSIYRLMDTIYDCPHQDDESISNMNNMKLKQTTHVAKIAAILPIIEKSDVKS